MARSITPAGTKPVEPKPELPIRTPGTSGAPGTKPVEPAPDPTPATPAAPAGPVDINWSALETTVVKGRPRDRQPIDVPPHVIALAQKSRETDSFVVIRIPGPVELTDGTAETMTKLLNAAGDKLEPKGSVTVKRIDWTDGETTVTGGALRIRTGLRRGGNKPAASEADKPAESAPEADKPAESAPEADKPAESAPEADKPAESAPEADKPAESAPEADKPAESAPAGKDTGRHV